MVLGGRALSIYYMKSLYTNQNGEKRGFDDFGSSGKACLIEKSWIIHTKRHLPQCSYVCAEKGMGVFGSILNRQIHQLH